jgi:hypothetical protein
MSKQYETREVMQKVNNPDGTQTEIRVAERRLKKAHDKMMSKLERRRSRAESEHLASVEANGTPAESQSLESHFEPNQPAESPKADRRRKKFEPSAPSPESETPAAEEVES